MVSVDLVYPEAFLLSLQMATFSLCLHIVYPLDAAVCPNLISYKNTSQIGLGPTLVTLF